MQTLCRVRHLRCARPIMVAFLKLNGKPSHPSYHHLVDSTLDFNSSSSRIVRYKLFFKTFPVDWLLYGIPTCTFIHIFTNLWLSLVEFTVDDCIEKVQQSDRKKTYINWDDSEKNLAEHNIQYARWDVFGTRKKSNAIANINRWEVLKKLVVQRYVQCRIVENVSQLEFKLLYKFGTSVNAIIITQSVIIVRISSK